MPLQQGKTSGSTSVKIYTITYWYQLEYQMCNVFSSKRLSLVGESQKRSANFCQERKEVFM